MLSRRFLLNSLIVSLCLGRQQNQTGTAIVIRLKDRKILYVENAEFAARAVLPPASTIKPYVVWALIEAGKLRAGDLFSCPRRLTMKGHSLNCIHPPTPVPMNPARALVYSCNVAIANFALRFAVDELPQALIRFGLTSPTHLVKMDEAAGVLKRNTAGADCQLQALGEEGIRVTPLELLLAYSRLSDKLKDPKYSPVLEGLEGAVEFGTAQAAKLKGIRVAGKTGSIVLESGAPAAWFAGFAPSRNPALAVVVLTPGHSGGVDAAPIAAALLKRYL